MEDSWEQRAAKKAVSDHLVRTQGKAQDEENVETRNPKYETNSNRISRVRILILFRIPILEFRIS